MDRIYSDSPHPQPFHHHCLYMQAVRSLVIGGHGKVCFHIETFCISCVTFILSFWIILDLRH